MERKARETNDFDGVDLRSLIHYILARKIKASTLYAFIYNISLILDLKTNTQNCLCMHMQEYFNTVLLSIVLHVKHLFEQNFA